MNNKVEVVEVLKWAFEKGYELGCYDTREGIHINFVEIQKYFLIELAKFNAQNELLETEIT